MDHEIRPRMTESDRLPSKVSLVIADVDGTLVTADKILTPRAGAAVKALMTPALRLPLQAGGRRGAWRC
jgi:hypothetical protein